MYPHLFCTKSVLQRRRLGEVTEGMSYKDLAEALHRLKVETGSLACFGCGYEHNCTAHGCAIVREAEKLILQKITGDGMRDDELIFYMECWREMQSFLTEVVRDNTREYPFAQDVLNLMKSIERKYEEH